MKGLILKDIYNMRKYGQTLCFLVGFYFIIGIASENTSLITAVTPVLFSMMSITAFSYDTVCKWDKYANTLPLTKKEIVSSRYILAIGNLVVGGICSIVILIVTKLMNTDVIILEQSMIIFYATLAGAIYISIMMPFIYKFGAERSRMIMFALALIPFAAVLLIGKLGIVMPSDAVLVWILKAVPFVGILLAIGSYFLSVRIYQNKEY